MIEERNRQYLVSRTTDGVELVDPTGRSVRPFEPSQVTTIKDNSFGLGFNPRKNREQYDDVIRMVSEKPEHHHIDMHDTKNVRQTPRTTPREALIRSCMFTEGMGYSYSSIHAFTQ